MFIVTDIVGGGQNVAAIQATAHCTFHSPDKGPRPVFSDLKVEGSSSFLQSPDRTVSLAISMWTTCKIVLYCYRTMSLVTSMQTTCKIVLYCYRTVSLVTSMQTTCKILPNNSLLWKKFSLIFQAEVLALLESLAFFFVCVVPKVICAIFRFRFQSIPFKVNVYPFQNISKLTSCVSCQNNAEVVGGKTLSGLIPNILHRNLPLYSSRLFPPAHEHCRSLRRR